MAEGGGGGEGGYAFQLCCGSVPTSSHIAGASAGDPQKPPHGMRTVKQQARLEQVLKTVLSDDYDATAWTAWIQGPAIADAPCQIQEDQITFLDLHKLEPGHFAVLQSMHKHHCFDEDAWAAMKTTMDRLAHEALDTGRTEGTRLTATGTDMSQLHPLI